MNKILLTIAIFCVFVVLVELSVYYSVSRVIKVTSKNGAEYAFSDSQIATFNNLLNFYSASKDDVFVDGAMNIKLVGYVSQVYKSKDKLDLSLCAKNKDDINCPSFSLDAINLSYTNTKELKDGNKIQMDLQYGLTGKNLKVKITKIE